MLMMKDDNTLRHLARMRASEASGRKMLMVVMREQRCRGMKEHDDTQTAFTLLKCLDDAHRVAAARAALIGQAGFRLISLHGAPAISMAHERRLSTYDLSTYRRKGRWTGFP